MQSGASPRNQPCLDHEVAGIWRPLAVSASAEGSGETRRSAPCVLMRARRRSGRPQQSCQVALQRDCQIVVIGLEQEQDAFNQRSNRLHAPARLARPARLLSPDALAMVRLVETLKAWPELLHDAADSG